jgi:hypothetical protein
MSTALMSVKVIHEAKKDWRLARSITCPAAAESAAPPVSSRRRSPITRSCTSSSGTYAIAAHMTNCA